MRENAATLLLLCVLRVAVRREEIFSARCARIFARRRRRDAARPSPASLRVEEEGAHFVWFRFVGVAFARARACARLRGHDRSFAPGSIGDVMNNALELLVTGGTLPLLYACTHGISRTAAHSSSFTLRMVRMVRTHTHMMLCAVLYQRARDACVLSAKISRMRVLVRRNGGTKYR